MAPQAVCCHVSTSSRLSSYLASTSAQLAGAEMIVERPVCTSISNQDDLRRHRLSAVLSEPITEASPVDLLDGKDKLKQGRSRGGGGRRSPKVRPKNGGAPDLPTGGPKLEWLKQEGINLTEQRTIRRINQAISSCSSVAEALGVIEEMKAAGLTAATEGTYLALITVCRRQRQGDRALGILQAMKQAGVKPGMLTYNTLISCCQQALRLEDAFRIKAEMETSGVKPDVVTYTSLMALVVKASPYRGRSSPAQRLEKAMDLYKEMLNSSVQPDAITFNTLMLAGQQAKLPGKVLEIYRTMVAAGVAPNHFTFDILLDAVGAGGRLKSALEVFNEMRATGITPQTSTYNFLIQACAAAPQPDAKRAWALFEDMKKVDNLVPNSSTFSNLVAACTKGGDHAGAMKAYELMQESVVLEPKTSRTTVTFNRLIHSAGVAGGLEKAFEMYENMREGGCEPDVTTYGTLVSACARADDLQRALALGTEFENMGIRPNQIVFHALMGAFGKADRWQDAVSTFRTMSSGEEPPTAMSYNIVLRACFGKSGIDGFIKHKAAEGAFDTTPGIEAAIHLYNEAVAAGFYKNYTDEDWSRCDVRKNSRVAVVVALLAWLKALREAPPASDLVVIVGTDRGQEQAKPKITWRYVVAEGTLKAVGLQSEQLNTITMQALTVRSETLKAWLTQSLAVEKDDTSSLVTDLQSGGNAETSSGSIGT